MRSFRLEPELDEKVQRAAAVSGQSVSEFIQEQRHRKVFSLDSDFYIYRIRGRQRFDVVPRR